MAADSQAPASDYRSLARALIAAALALGVMSCGSPTRDSSSALCSSIAESARSAFLGVDPALQVSELRFDDPARVSVPPAFEVVLANEEGDGSSYRGVRQPSRIVRMHRDERSCKISVLTIRDDDFDVVGYEVRDDAARELWAVLCLIESVKPPPGRADGDLPVEAGHRARWRPITCRVRPGLGGREESWMYFSGGMFTRRKYDSSDEVLGFDAVRAAALARVVMEAAKSGTEKSVRVEQWREWVLRECMDIRPDGGSSDDVFMMRARIFRACSQALPFVVNAEDADLLLELVRRAEAARSSSARALDALTVPGVERALDLIPHR